MNNTNTEQKKDLSTKYNLSAKVLSFLVFIATWCYIFISRSTVHKSHEKYAKTYSYIIASNHISFIDPFLVTPAAGVTAFSNVPYRFMSYNGYLNKWFLKWFMLPLGCFPSHEHKKYLHGIKAAENMLYKGHTVVIFPQGKRTDDKTIAAKYGVEHLSRLPNVKIIPILLKKESKYAYSIRVGTSFGASDMSAQEIMNSVYDLNNQN